MDQTIRSFIAIELEPALKDELSRVQIKLREILRGKDNRPPLHPPEPAGGIKWVEPANIHLTLRFLGDVPASQIAQVKTALEKTAAAFPPFSIQLAQAGAFPDLSRPRIIWIGIEKGSDSLDRIVQSLEVNLAGLPVKADDRHSEPLVFAAHITLGRLRLSAMQKPLARALETLPPTSGVEQQVKKLTLFKSQLTSNGPIYSILAEAPFAIKTAS